MIPFYKISINESFFQLCFTYTHNTTSIRCDTSMPVLLTTGVDESEKIRSYIELINNNDYITSSDKSGRILILLEHSIKKNCYTHYLYTIDHYLYKTDDSFVNISIKQSSIGKKPLKFKCSIAELNLNILLGKSPAILNAKIIAKIQAILLYTSNKLSQFSNEYTHIEQISKNYLTWGLISSVDLLYMNNIYKYLQTNYTTLDINETSSYQHNSDINAKIWTNTIPNKW